MIFDSNGLIMKDGRIIRERGVYIFYILMPKLIDNYVLSRKIGAGQYGEVFKGYDRATNNDIAVKSIRR